MGLHRPKAIGSTSGMFAQRMGGRVTLFNYNPKIAGGSLNVTRFNTAHRRGQYLRHKEHEHVVNTVSAGAGLTNPGHAAKGGGANYQGLGATGRTAMHPFNAERKRLHEVIASKMNNNTKKARC